MDFDAYIFDLDGTVLNTLSDLVNITNMALAEHDMPARTSDEINSFVGNGARVLIQRAAAPDATEDEIDAVLARWKELYPEFGHKYTKPYDGMPETLAALKEGGAKLAVLSNKFDAAAQSVIAEHYPGVFDVVRGESPDTPRKPDPTGLFNVMGELGVEPERVAYVGDSGSDMTVAHAAGCMAVGVTWGYRSVEVLKAAGADVLIDEPSQLYNVKHQPDRKEQR